MREIKNVLIIATDESNTRKALVGLQFNRVYQ